MATLSCACQVDLVELLGCRRRSGCRWRALHSDVVGAGIPSVASSAPRHARCWRSTHPPGARCTRTRRHQARFWRAVHTTRARCDDSGITSSRACEQHANWVSKPLLGHVGRHNTPRGATSHLCSAKERQAAAASSMAPPQKARCNTR
jgi:hypothetical protein